MFNTFTRLLAQWSRPEPKTSLAVTTLPRAEAIAVNPLSTPEVARQSSLGQVNLQETAVSVVALYNQAPCLAQTAERMDKHAEEQAQTIDRIVEKTDAITQTLNSVIEGLDGSTKEAFTSVKLIRQITDGARILAINASIEAARAGQAGLPFNVVAVEMQRLSLQIEEASEHLGRTLGNMQKKVNDVVRVVGGGETKSADLEEASSIAAMTKAFRSIDDRAKEQQKESHAVHKMSENTRIISERLLMEVGKLRFEIHAKSEAAVAGLIDHPDLSSGKRSQIEPLLMDAIREHSFFDLLYVTDATGRQITRNVGQDCANPEAGKEVLGHNWSMRPWFENALKHHGPVTSDLYVSVTTNRFCFTVSHAIVDEDGAVCGVLGADVDFERLLMLRAPERAPLGDRRTRAVGADFGKPRWQLD